jgi:FG-GAP repeat
VELSLPPIRVAWRTAAALAWGTLPIASVGVVSTPRQSLPAHTGSATLAVRRSLDPHSAVSASDRLSSTEDRRAQYLLATDPVIREASKLVSTEGSLASQFGDHVALSADGETALVGAPEDSEGRGAAWVFVKTEAGWVQQGGMLTPNDAVGKAEVGDAVALSANGDVAVVGGESDNASRGAAWIFTRAHGVWTQQGRKLEPSDADPGSHVVLFGVSVAVSADGNTVLVGGSGDKLGGYGAAWVFAHSGGTWVQQGPKLTAPNEVLGSDLYYSWFGSSVALSGDGNTALIGAEDDEVGAGAAWVFVRSGSEWLQQGSKLTSGEHAGQQLFGDSVSLSGDGNTALIGGEEASERAGAAWTFVRNGASWSQAGKLTSPDLASYGEFGSSVALDATGSYALVGADRDGEFSTGRAWLYARSGAGWSTEPRVVVPEGVFGFSLYGLGVAVSTNATALLVGAPEENEASGAAWMFETGSISRTYIAMMTFGEAAFPPRQGIDARVEFLSERAPTGTVTWRWYGPNAAGCSGAPVGVLTVPVVAGPFSSTAATLPVPSLGKYIVVASYGGDGATVPTATACGETLVDVKSRPMLNVAFSGPARVGSPLRIVMHLEGGTEPSGKITVSIFSVHDPGCDEAAVSVQELNVTGGVSPEVEYTPTAPGKLYLQANYGGDGNNFEAHYACEQTGAPVIGLAEPTAGTSVPSSVSVGEPIAATSQILGGYQPSGSVTFTLFPPTDPTCSGSPAASVNVPLAGGTVSSGQFATTATGRYHFVTRYSGDVDNLAIGTPCATAAVEVVKRRPGLTVRAVSDVAGYGSLDANAQLEGAFAPAGNVTFSLYRANQHCRGRPILTVLAAVGNATATTGLLGLVGTGRYEIVAAYEGDANNEAVQSKCGVRSVLVPPIVVRATGSSRGVHIALRCEGVRTRTCRGTITVSTRSSDGKARTVGEIGYTVRRGKTVMQTIRLDALGRRLLRSGSDTALLLTVRLRDEGTNKTVQRTHVTAP